MTAQSEHELLEERARRLAQPTPRPELSLAREQLLAFRRGDRRYAIDTRFVLEVQSVAAFALLPGVPAHCQGLVATRGELIALFDLAVLLGAAPDNDEPPKQMLLCGEARAEFAVVIDEALALYEPQTLWVPHAQSGSLVAGVHPDGITVVDGAQMLNDPRFTLNNTIEEDAP